MPWASAFSGIHRDQQELLAEDVVEQADGAVQRGGLAHFEPGHGEDIAHQHFLQVFGLLRRFAHGQNRRRGSHGVADADDRFLRNPRLLARGSVEKTAAPMNVKIRLTM